ncbi:hypothetical protein NDU88_001092 [Pleurodeles waltl]|uniref:Uncharacterized protein n=1 Tax=Pleurodeles waltl TaxID=8319 RepID=A0AAV7P2X3_PLEWA|nr:hypothetical protein NDU88_001092 [Pleurodeles waltl]
MWTSQESGIVSTRCGRHSAVFPPRKRRSARLKSRNPRVFSVPHQCDSARAAAVCRQEPLTAPREPRPVLPRRLVMFYVSETRRRGY